MKNSSGRVRVAKKKFGSGRVAGTRQTLLERAMCLDQFKILVSLGTGAQQCDSPGKALLALLLEVSEGKENASHRFKNKLLSLTEANRKEVCNIKMATCKQSQLIFLFRLKNYQCLGEHS